MSEHESYYLERFLDAQSTVYDTALGELRAGRKKTHWMWFIFPQMKGLGRSAMAERYGIGSMQEAGAYLAHPILGSRLETCTQAVLQCKADSLYEIFGAPDDSKFCSSMTLFAIVSKTENTVFQKAIDTWCNGRQDAKTQMLLAL